MFQISVMVDDAKLAKVLNGLDGLVLGEPVVRPVRGAVVSKGKIKSTQPVPGGSMIDNVAALLTEGRYSWITGDQLRGLIEKAGGAPAGSGYYVKHLKQRKVIGPLAYSGKNAGYYPVKK